MQFILTSSSAQSRKSQNRFPIIPSSIESCVLSHGPYIAELTEVSESFVNSAVYVRTPDRLGIEDNSKKFSYFSKKTFVLTPH